MTRRRNAPAPAAPTRRARIYAALRALVPCGMLVGSGVLLGTADTLEDRALAGCILIVSLIFLAFVALAFRVRRRPAGPILPGRAPLPSTGPLVLRAPGWALPGLGALWVFGVLLTGLILAADDPTTRAYALPFLMLATVPAVISALRGRLRRWTLELGEDGVVYRGLRRQFSAGWKELRPTQLRGTGRDPGVVLVTRRNGEFVVRGLPFLRTDLELLDAVERRRVPGRYAR